MTKYSIIASLKKSSKPATRISIFTLEAMSNYKYLICFIFGIFNSLSNKYKIVVDIDIIKVKESINVNANVNKN